MDGGRFFIRKGDIFLGNPLWGEEYVISHPEKLSGRQFYPVTPAKVIFGSKFFAYLERKFK